MKNNLDDYEINIFKTLDFIRDHATAYAKAKSERIYLEEYRKTKKALCMKDAEVNKVTVISAQERDAYAHPEYQQVLEGLREAVHEEERLRWLIIAAQAKIEVWRSLQSSKRFEAKIL